MLLKNRCQSNRHGRGRVVVLLGACGVLERARVDSFRCHPGRIGAAIEKVIIRDG